MSIDSNQGRQSRRVGMLTSTPAVFQTGRSFDHNGQISFSDRPLDPFMDHFHGKPDISTPHYGVFQPTPGAHELPLQIQGRPKDIAPRLDLQSCQQSLVQELSPSHSYAMSKSPIVTMSPSKYRQQKEDLNENFSASQQDYSPSGYGVQTTVSRHTNDMRPEPKYHSRRRSYNQDEFDGPSQLLPPPFAQEEYRRSRELIPQPVTLNFEEQEVLEEEIDTILSKCAFYFIAKYQFPIPLEREKPHVRTPKDREWTEWAYLLKRLATKRRIPARVLYENQIRQLVTTLENSVPVRYNLINRNERQAAKIPRNDRYMLQRISSAIQVAKILLDSLAMEQLDELYTRTSLQISERQKHQSGFSMSLQKLDTEF